MILDFPQECSTMKNETEVQRISNSLNTSNVLKAIEETITNDSGVNFGQGSESKVIQNNCKYKEMNSKDSEISSLRIHPTKCSKTPVSYACKKSKANKHRPTVRKGTQHSFSSSNPVFNYTIRYVTRKRNKAQNAEFSSSCDTYNITNILTTEAALEDTTSYSIGTDYDTDAILNEYKIVPPISNFDDTCVLSVNLHSIEKNSSHERGHFSISTDVETEVHKVDDICNYDKDDVQFRSDASGALIPFAASSMYPKTTDNLTVTGKQINFTCHTTGYNLSEKHVNDDGKAVITHHSLQETRDHSVDAWPWTDLFPPGNKSDDNDMQFPTMKACMYMCNTMSNHTVNESTTLSYTNNLEPRDVMSDNINTDKPEQFWNYVNCTGLNIINSNDNNVSENIQENNKQNNSVTDYQKTGYVEVEFSEHLSFLENNQYTIL